MKATRAGMGCGSCKKFVGEVVDFFCDGAAEVDPSIHYYVPTVPLKKPELVAAVREQGLRSVSSVFRVLGGGIEDPITKPALASLLATVWADEYDNERDARFISDRVHGNVQKDGRFSVVLEMAGGVCTPDELMRIAKVAANMTFPSSRLPAASELTSSASPRTTSPPCGRNSTCPPGRRGAKVTAPAKAASATPIAASGLCGREWPGCLSLADHPQAGLGRAVDPARRAPGHRPAIGAVVARCLLGPPHCRTVSDRQHQSTRRSPPPRSTLHNNRLVCG